MDSASQIPLYWHIDHQNELIIYWLVTISVSAVGIVAILKTYYLTHMRPLTKAELFYNMLYCKAKAFRKRCRMGNTRFLLSLSRYNTTQQPTPNHTTTRHKHTCVYPEDILLLQTIGASRFYVPMLSHSFGIFWRHKCTYAFKMVSKNMSLILRNISYRTKFRACMYSGFFGDYHFANIHISESDYYLFSISVATPGSPRQISELNDKLVVAIVLGPNKDYPNAYMHISGKFLIRI